MTLEYGKFRLLVPALLAASIGLIGCGGGGDGGGGGGNAPATGITVVPERFDFGVITEGNLDQVLPRKFIIRNEGTTSSNIGYIMWDQFEADQFSLLDHLGGNNACAPTPFALAPGESCTVEVEFNPDEIGEFKTALFVQNDAPNVATVGGTLARVEGTYAEVDEIHVTVNQVHACAVNGPQAFVSVTDQERFPIRNLHKENFILEGLDPIYVRQVGENDAYIPLSLSIAMDYSGSITDFPEVVDNMEAGATLLVNEMKANDNADIIVAFP
ncbi:hypothetical protein [Thioalkalivibrio sp. ALMg13-2]|uniref:hypothetical protein n=1 Tax=Thioalkalivibrio sp. ALMg13-2 TaxID=1158167 RepID=UPI00037FB4EA|nr:hypothetical protein [Thioalkalivibrio sp. ALMg13-2]